MAENTPARTDQTAPAPAPAQPAGPQQQQTMTHLLQVMLPEIQRALPKHMDGDRFLRVILTAMRKTPRLAQCTPDSFFGALLTAAALGLEPDVNGECYLVPYKDGNASKGGRTVYRCELIIGYQGYAKLFWQHPLAKRLTTETVYENDHFRFSKGLVQQLEHEPAQGERGRPIGYWALVELTTGAQQFDYFTADQIRKLRNGRVGSSGDIADPEHWLERKTALRQVMKLMPKSTRLGTFVSVDDQAGSLDVGRAIAAQNSNAAIMAAPTNIDPETGEVLEGETR